MEFLRSEGAVRVTEVAEALNMSPGGAHNYLATLVENGWVTREGSKYVLSNHLVTFGEHVRNRSEIFAAGWEEIDRLAEETGEKVHLVVEVEGHCVTLYEEFGENAVGTQYCIENRERATSDLHCTSSGKAILAHLPTDRSTSVLDEHEFQAHTQNTITERSALESELEKIRDEGVAYNDEEEIVGLRAVSAPIVDPSNDEVLGAIGVGGPTSRFEGQYYEEELPTLVRDTANVIQVNIQTQDYVIPN
jgi:DNA-binding IclR family transcriptional regulator